MKKKVIIIGIILLLITVIGYGAYNRFAGSWFLGQFSPNRSENIECYMVQIDNCQYIIVDHIDVRTNYHGKGVGVGTGITHKGDCNNPIHFESNTKKK